MGGLFKQPKTPPAPTPAPPAPMPDAENPAVLEAKRKATQMAFARGGRQSTILSAGAASDGGGSSDSFSSKTLG